MECTQPSNLKAAAHPAASAATLVRNPSAAAAHHHLPPRLEPWFLGSNSLKDAVAAFEASPANGGGLGTVVSYDLKPRHGSKIYHVTPDVEAFDRAVQTTVPDPRHRNAYEVLVEGQRVKPYFDLEYLSTAATPVQLEAARRDFITLLTLLKANLQRACAALLGVAAPTLMFLDGSRQTSIEIRRAQKIGIHDALLANGAVANGQQLPCHKFSCHILIHGFAFEYNTHPAMRFFVERAIPSQTMHELAPHLLWLPPPHTAQTVPDMKVYGKCQNFRMLGSCKRGTDVPLSVMACLSDLTAPEQHPDTRRACLVTRVAGLPTARVGSTVFVNEPAMALLPAATAAAARCSHRAPPSFPAASRQNVGLLRRHETSTGASKRGAELLLLTHRQQLLQQQQQQQQQQQLSSLQPPPPKKARREDLPSSPASSGGGCSGSGGNSSSSSSSTDTCRNDRDAAAADEAEGGAVLLEARLEQLQRAVQRVLRSYGDVSTDVQCLAEVSGESLRFQCNHYGKGRFCLISNVEHFDNNCLLFAEPPTIMTATSTTTTTSTSSSTPTLLLRDAYLLKYNCPSPSCCTRAVLAELSWCPLAQTYRGNLFFPPRLLKNPVSAPIRRCPLPGAVFGTAAAARACSGTAAAKQVVPLHDHLPSFLSPAVPSLPGHAVVQAVTPPSPSPPRAAGGVDGGGDDDGCGDEDDEDDDDEEEEAANAQEPQEDAHGAIQDTYDAAGNGDGSSGDGSGGPGGGDDPPPPPPGKPEPTDDDNDQEQEETYDHINPNPADDSDNYYPMVKQRFELYVFQIDTPVGYVFLGYNKYDRHIQLLKRVEVANHFESAYFVDPDNLNPADGKPERKPFVTAWLKDSKKKKKLAIVYVPGQAPQHVYNSWGGFYADRLPPVPREQVEAIVAPIVAHIRQCIANGKEADLLFVLKWLAQIVRFPNTKTQVALFLYGTEGCGKNLVFDLMQSILGAPNGFQTSSPERDIFGTFTTAFDKAILIQTDEVTRIHSYESLFKDYVTGETVRSEHKGKDAKTVVNRANFVFTSNTEGVFTISPFDRRCVLFNCSACFVGNEPYFHFLQNYRRQAEVIRSFYQYLLEHVDLPPDFQFQYNRPKTEFYKEQQKLCIRPLEQFLSSVVVEYETNRLLSFRLGLTGLKFKQASLWKLFQRFLEASGEKFEGKQNSFTKLLLKKKGVRLFKEALATSYVLDVPVLKADMISNRVFDDDAAWLVE